MVNELKKRDCGINIKLTPSGAQFLHFEMDIQGDHLEFLPASTMGEQFGAVVSALYTTPRPIFMFLSAKQCFLVLFCQLNRAFSCSRVLLFPRSPHRTMVKDVVKETSPLYLKKGYIGLVFIFYAHNFFGSNKQRKSYNYKGNKIKARDIKNNKTM